MKTRSTIDWTMRSLALALLFFGQACIDDKPTGPLDTREVDAREAAPTSQEELGESPLMLGLARQVPGFGGLYYEPGGERLVIAMTEANRAGFPAARQAVLASLAADLTLPSIAGVPPVDFVERVVEYSFIELARHRARLRPRLFAIPGVASLQVDEEFNRIKIGLLNPSARNAVLDLASELAVPAAMLSFSEASPIEEVHMSSDESHVTPASARTLNGRITLPDGRLRGGYRFWAKGNGPCTLGFTAIRAQRPPTKVLVSASHCSQRPFRTDLGDWGQPDTLRIVGIEILDPEPRDCWSWRPWFRKGCRDADAALIRANTNPGIALAEIARTTSRADCSTNCILNINTADPTISIQSVRRSNVANETLDKIGRKTGWTFGAVEETCVDLYYDGVYRDCSDCVDFKVRGGDSGGPVFRYDDDGTAQLRGVVWGRNRDDDWGLISNFGQVEKDLGRLWVTDPGPPTIDSIAGPRVVPPDHMCHWSAGTLGMYPLDHEWSGVLTRNTDTDPNIWDTVSESGWLKLTVTDIVDRIAEDSISVTVDEDAEKPERCWKVGDPPIGP